MRTKVNLSLILVVYSLALNVYVLRSWLTRTDDGETQLAKEYSVNMRQNTVTETKFGKGDILAVNDVLNTVLKQRNELSTLLNEMRMKVGQMQCEANGGHTSEQGGWCKKSSTEHGGNHMTDQRFVPVLSRFLKGKTVGSFGDGPGAYKREMLKLGEVAGYDSYDGAPYSQETSEGRVKFLDLSVPQYGLPIYDYVMSLEVDEHVPQKYEAFYLDNIFRHAKEGIILSWAVPAQGGLGHINSRPLNYVIDVMNKNGFSLDRDKSKLLQDGAEFSWLKKNTHVYIRDKDRSPAYEYV